MGTISSSPEDLQTHESKLRRRRDHIRILVADKTRMGCELIATALARDRQLQITASATTVNQVVAAATTTAPHILLLGYDLGDGPGSGLKALRSLNGLHDSIRAIILFENDEHENLVESFHAGAKAILRRSDSLRNLVRCVHAVHEGQIWASSADLNLILQAFASSGPLRCVSANGENMLTAREQQVLQLVADGHSNLEIANQLQIREHTVKNYLFKIYDKLGVSTRVELILYAISRSRVA